MVCAASILERGHRMPTARPGTNSIADGAARRGLAGVGCEDVSASALTKWRRFTMAAMLLPCQSALLTLECSPVSRLALGHFRAVAPP